MNVRQAARLSTGRAPRFLVLGVLASMSVGVVHPPRVDAAMTAASLPPPVQISVPPVSVGQPPQTAFAKSLSFDIAVPAFSDADIARFLSTLTAMLNARPADASSTDDARIWEVARGIQTGQLSHAQEVRIDQALDAASRARPTSAPLVGRIRHVVDTLTIGKVAPDITGRDLDGSTFKLSDYRGKVVALIFSGEWCGICRTQYPYERLLLELYKNWPFAMLGVNSDADGETARKSMADRGLGYRTWWDGYLPDNTSGPIATNWSISGWPTVYVIDPTGVIRFVDLRQEDLLKGVRQLLTTQSQPAPAPAPKLAHK
jgi:thiol-disulfide isomerase/thioredoxin